MAPGTDKWFNAPTGGVSGIAPKRAARHGNYGETGMAHLLERMVSKGTPKHPDIPAEVRAHGAQNNASIGIDYTNYFQHFAAEHWWLLFLRNERNVGMFIPATEPQRATIPVAPSAAEVERFQAGVLQEVAQRRSSDGYLCAHWRELLDRGSTFAGEEEFETALRGLTVTRINAALKQRFDFTRLTVIKAGDMKLQN